MPTLIWREGGLVAAVCLLKQLAWNPLKTGS